MQRLARLLVVGVVAALLVAPSGPLAKDLVASASSRGTLAATAAAVPGSGGPTVADAARAPPHGPRVPALGTTPVIARPCDAAPAGVPSDDGTPARVPDDVALASSSTPTDGVDSLAPEASSVIDAAVEAGACPNTIFPPRPPASPAQIAAAQESGIVQPLYTGTPAPTGLAEYGVSVLANGTRVASEMDTPSLRGQADVNSTGIHPLDLYNSATGPDAYSLQLNGVLTEVRLIGRAGYEFWTQDVMEYYPSARMLFLISNIWNFSGSFSLGSAIYRHGANGSVYSDEVYIAEAGFPNISYPFDLSLYLNSTVVDGRDAVYFSGDLQGPGEAFAARFDYVVFNSIASGGAPVASPALYSANGTGYDPLGLMNDFELTVGGPGDGSQATLFAGNAELGLAFWNAGADGGLGGYVCVPSAFNFGSDTAETSTGATVTWRDSPGGPGGLSAYGTMTTGPSILEGLWNASGPEGSYPVTVDSSPSNAFQLVNPVVKSPWTEVELGGPPTGPRARTGPAVAYDPALGATVLFGGYVRRTGSVLGDTWEFAQGRWTNVTGPTGPPARYGASMVYDAAEGRLLLFGGWNPDVGGLNDTWAYGADGWHSVAGRSAPSPRAYAGMTYDATDADVLLFGGGLPTYRNPELWKIHSDTWTFGPAGWTNVTASAGAGPRGRIMAGLAYDAADQEALLVGGATNGLSTSCPYTLPGAWAFSGGRWTEVASTGAAPPAGGGSLWFDSATQTTYYYEGAQNLSSRGAGCEVFVGKVYSFHGGTWKLIYPGSEPGAPGPRVLSTVVDDRADHSELLFGGQQGASGATYPDVWSFDPNRTTIPAQPQVVPDTSLGPTVTTTTFWLAPGNYSLTTALSGYDPRTTPLNVTGPMTVSPTLTANSSTGIYTPLWVWRNSQFPAVSTAGVGSPTSPYVLENSPSEELGLAFGLFNDAGFPVYPGMFLLDTSAAVEVLDPPPYLAAVSLGSEAPSLVAGNSSLPLWFWNASGVALSGGVDLGAEQIAPISTLGPFDIVFYDSSHDLVAGNSFAGTWADLLLESGPGPGRFTGTGGQNTIWGNVFARNGVFTSNFPVTGLMELEPYDLVYNNRFLTNVTACSPGDPADLNDCWPIYSFSTESFSDRWNVTPQPASIVHYAAGFPDIPLTGSVTGSPQQGGNYWWDYGTPPNDFGILPYDELHFPFGIIVASARDAGPATTTYVPFIDPGGDYAPLTEPVSVRFVEFGLPARLLLRTGWTLALNGTTETVRSESVVFGPEFAGTAPLLVTGPPGYRTTSSGVLHLAMANVTVDVTFVPGATYSLTFEERGLGAGSTWCPAVDGLGQCSSASSLKFSDLSPGTYDVSMERPTSAGLAVTARCHGSAVELSQLRLHASERVILSFIHPVRFLETGLLTGSTWSVRVGHLSGAAVAGSASVIELNLTNGTYVYRAKGPPGYTSIGDRHFVVDGVTIVTVVFQAARS